MFSIVGDNGATYAQVLASEVTSLSSNLSGIMIDWTNSGGTAEVTTAPVGTYYDVQPGDTLNSVGVLLGQSPNLVSALNGNTGSLPAVGASLMVADGVDTISGQQGTSFTWPFGGPELANYNYVFNLGTQLQPDVYYTLPSQSGMGADYLVDGNGNLVTVLPVNTPISVINWGLSTQQVTANGVTYAENTNGSVTPSVSGTTFSGGLSLSLSAPQQAGLIQIVDTSGSGSFTLSSNDFVDWTAGAGTDTATLNAGTTYISMAG